MTRPRIGFGIALLIAALGDGAAAAQQPRRAEDDTVRLLYAVDVEDAIARGLLSPKIDPDPVVERMQQAVLNKAREWDVGAEVARVGRRQLEVRVPARADVHLLDAALTTHDRMRIALIATAPQVARESRRLESWLHAVGPGGTRNRARVIADPARLAEFDALSADRGGRLDPDAVLWVAGLVLPSADDPTHWSVAWSELESSPVVPLFDVGDYVAGPPAEARTRPYLVELFPLDTTDDTFTDHDIANASAITIPGMGGRAVHYTLRRERVEDALAFSVRNPDRLRATMVDGLVRAVEPAPLARFGILRCGFTAAEARALAVTLNGPDLELPLRRVERR